MNALDGILAAIRDEPADPGNWLVLADWLEESGEPDRADVVRLQRALPTLKGRRRDEVETRLRELLAAGVRPCAPTWQSASGIELVLIPPGKFRMGSPVREWHRMDDEPLHDVQITRSFYLGIYPVTQAQYRAVTKRNPSLFTQDHEDCRGLDTDRFPVDRVSWQDASAFCRTLTRRERTERLGLEYRLPTEAEWEYACRAWTATKHPFHFGPALTAKLANFNGAFPFPAGQFAEKAPSLERPTPVGTYPPNGFGLYDMHGNVDEWVEDWFEEDYYAVSPSQDPRGPEEGELKVIRGGSWRGQGEDCRAAVRIGEDPTDGDNNIGFRVVLAPTRG